MAKLYVKDIMSKNPISVSEDTTVKEALRTMDKNKISSLLVSCGGDRPFGIATRKDVIREIIIKDGDAGMQISKIMTTPLIFATPNLRIKDAAILIERYKVRRLPVLKKGEVVGMVSTSDIFKYIVDKAIPKQPAAQ